MAITIQVPGLVTVKVDTGSSNTLESLGYTENGIEITRKKFFLPVHGDENGGDAGPPVDQQYMGELDIIRMLFTKWDEAIGLKVRPTLYGGTAGTPGTAGTLMFQGTKSFRLVLDCLSDNAHDLNYPRVIFEEPEEVNHGTKHAKWMLIATAYKNGSGILFNTST